MGYLEKKVEVIEEYTEKSQRISVPKPLPYNLNQLILKEVPSLSKTFSLLLNQSGTNHYSEAFVNQHSYWFDTKSYEEALTTFNNHQIINRPLKINKMPHVLITEHRIKKEFNDMVGYFPNVPAYIQGNPLSMFNRKLTTSFSTSVNLHYNICVDSTENNLNYAETGQLFFDFVESLLKKKIKLNLHIYSAAYTKNQTLILKFNVNLDEWETERKLLHYLLTKITFFRLFILNFISQLPELEKDWNVGFGHMLHVDTLKQLVKVKKQEEFFSNRLILNKYCANKSK